MGARVLVIDNYDSFVYNLVQYLGALGAEPVVHRNDAVPIQELVAGGYAGVLVSPGPGTPDGAGLSLDVLDAFPPEGVAVLGVCLGLQCIGQRYGGRVVRAPQVMHGKTSPVHHDGRTLFEGVATPVTVTRYHSLIVRRETLPACLEVSAWTTEEEVMAVRHREHRIEGIQFHPESFLTEAGDRMIANFLAMVEGD